MFSERLKAARKKQKLSQVKLAEILGVSQQTIAAWENGVSTPDINTLKKLSEIFMISLDYMLENYIVKTPDGHIVREDPAYYGFKDASDKAKKIYSKICTLDDQQIDYLDDMLPLVKRIKYKR